MTRPSAAIIGPFRYKITDKPSEWKRCEVDQDGHWGFTHQTSATILLTPGMNPVLERAVLLHELLHACSFAGGMLDTRKRDEETWVALVAPMLLDAISRSPGMAAFLFGSKA